MEITFTEKGISTVAGKILDKAESKVLALYGQMGAGKTTLIKALLKELGAIDRGSSPTFGIVNEYHDSDGQLLAYHFDFYRLEDPSEALDLGLDDYLLQDAWVFMEWPEKIEEFLPADCHHVYLDVIDASTRRVTI